MHKFYVHTSSFSVFVQTHRANVQSPTMIYIEAYLDHHPMQRKVHIKV